MVANYHQSRQPELYGVLIAFLVLNNVTVAARLFANWRVFYRAKRSPFVEDIFILLSGILVNAIIGNLLASTHYGLGLHSERIVETDPHKPYNLTKVFQHVWICMSLVGPTFTFIKLSLLFFYRRLFLVNQKWLRIAWWANLVYVILWFFGATGFYIFQCWPVQWYWMRYYSRYHVPTPGDMKGQCNATTVHHVAMPLIFGLISDIALLLLPITTILRLSINMKKKLGLAGVFSVGVVACLLELARIIELEVDTDDSADPSYGVVVFLILSVAEEVSAIMCASLPVIFAHLFKEYKKHHDTRTPDLTSSVKMQAMNLNSHSRNTSKGFHKLGEGAGGSGSGDGLSSSELTSSADRQLEWTIEPRPANTVTAEHPPTSDDETEKDESHIIVKKEFAVVAGLNDQRV